ncbi:MAG: hypothetical protein Q8R39_01585 [bacterium]|nr:hypothetical protein [bacterium]MDZ4284540.1 hypothetical protein [Patescibacteria group bacterium]
MFRKMFVAVAVVTLVFGVFGTSVIVFADDDWDGLNLSDIVETIVDGAGGPTSVVINTHSEQLGEIYIREGDFEDITTSNVVFGALLLQALDCDGCPEAGSSLVFNGWSKQSALTVIEHASTGAIDVSSVVAGAAKIVTVPTPSP